VLENSEIGKALTAAATGPAEALGLSAEFSKLQAPVSLYWYDRVQRTLTDRGAIVKAE
jgi:hypothetical protein